MDEMCCGAVGGFRRGRLNNWTGIRLLAEKCRDLRQFRRFRWELCAQGAFFEEFRGQNPVPGTLRLGLHLAAGVAEEPNLCGAWGLFPVSCPGFAEPADGQACPPLYDAKVPWMGQVPHRAARWTDRSSHHNQLCLCEQIHAALRVRALYELPSVASVLPEMRHGHCCAAERKIISAACVILSELP